MAKYEFVANYGVALAGLGQFERDRDLDTPEGEKRYRFDTDDAEVAKKVRAVEGYGIVEVSKPAKRKDAE